MIEYTQQQAEEFQRYKDTLPKEPTEPGVKKEYVIGCHSAEDWKYIHEVLMQDGTVIEYLFFFKNGSNIHTQKTLIMYDGSSSDVHSQEYAIMTSNGPLVDIVPVVLTVNSSKQLLIVGSIYPGITSVDYKFTRTILQ